MKLRRRMQPEGLRCKMKNTTRRYGAWGVERGLKAESWMAGLRKYAGDFLRRSREALDAGFIHLASTCPVTWRCWMRAMGEEGGESFDHLVGAGEPQRRHLELKVHSRLWREELAASIACSSALSDAFGSCHS